MSDTKRYSTKQDAIEQAILPALGDYAGGYNLDAIFNEAFEYRTDVDGKGNELLNTAGFECVASDDDDFWAIVERHEAGGGECATLCGRLALPGDKFCGPCSDPPDPHER